MSSDADALSTAPAASSTRWSDDLSADLARYRAATYLPRFWWLTEKTTWALAVFRVGQGIRTVDNRLLGLVLRAVFWPVSMAIHLSTSIELWADTKIGPGLRIYHGVGLVVNPLAVIGSNATLYQGVTIGSRHAGKRVAPVIGDDVIIGAHAVVLGDIRIGDGARIGANAVVVQDVPAGATVVGAASRVIERTDRTAAPELVDTQASAKDSAL